MNNSNFVICNLLAGGGQAKKRWDKFLSDVGERGIEITTKITERHGHAIDIANDAVKSGIRRIAVFGGDGTLNEALNGILKANKSENRDTELIYLGAGSSCDVEKNFPDKQPLIDRLLSKHHYTVDVCRVECYDFSGNKIERYFLANSSIGVISLAVHLFNRKTPFMDFLKRVNIDLAALSQGVKALLKFDRMGCTISIDGKNLQTIPLKNLTVFKCAYFGGGMNYGIETEFDDKQFHVALIDNVNRLTLFSMIPPLYTGTILENKHAHHYVAKSFDIKNTGKDAYVETDGEIVGVPPCRYTILPECLKLIL